MTQRERKLSIAAGGVLAGFMVFMVVQRVVLNPISELRTKIADKLTQRADLEAKVRMEASYRRLWTELDRKTLAPDPARAAGRLDELVKSLMTEAGLQRFTVNPGEPKQSPKKDYWIVPYTVVAAECNMQAFARFLHGFYQQPYAMQITGFNLDPATFRKGGVLRVSSLTIEALVLSRDGLPSDLPSHSTPADRTPVVHASATAPAAGPSRLKEPSLEAYAVLWDKKFMEPYVPQKVEVPPPPPPPPQVVPTAMPNIAPAGGSFTGPVEVRITCSTPGATIRYTTDGTDPNPTSGQVYSNPVRLEHPGTIKAIAYQEGKPSSPVAMATFAEPPPPPMTLFMLTTHGVVNEVVLRNEQTKQRQIVREGEEMDGGHLILVLPQAAVVEMPDGPRYVYRLGKGFGEKEILDETRQPDVWAAVQLLVDSQ